MKNKLNIKGKIGRLDQSTNIQDSDINEELLNREIDNDITASELGELDQSLSVKNSKVRKSWIIALSLIIGLITTVATLYFKSKS